MASRLKGSPAAGELRARIARLAGVETHYDNAWGELRSLNDDEIDALLAALGATAADSHTLESLEADPWRCLLPPVQVLRQGEALEIPIVVPQARRAAALSWRLQTEDGETYRGTATVGELPKAAANTLNGCDLERYRLRLSVALAPGYHTLRVSVPDGGAYAQGETRLIIAPAKCFLPATLAAGGRTWGFAVQLYALRSAHNWGIGDFGDLLRLVEGAATLGAGVIGVNPLHAAFLNAPERTSPYAPSSRQFLNVLYIDVPQVADFADCAAAQARVSDPAFQARLQALRTASLVDYSGVAGCKLEILELLYGSFREQHLGENDSAHLSKRGEAFRQFQREHSPALRTYATFEALAEQQGADGKPLPWPQWPESCRDPHDTAVQEFAHRRHARIECYEYLQWLAHQQLDAVDQRCRVLGLPIGLYLDLAIGVAGDGADTWADRQTYATGAAVGAPPDRFNPQGQDWGLPPAHPQALRTGGYASFIAILRANMRHAGALRIDHVFALLRLYWIPRGQSPSTGGYVHYPLEDLLGVLALESQRHRCMVIGEDLGTVPKDLRERLQAADVLSYRLLYFEQDEDGRLLAPDTYPRLALAGITTHDLPTLPGYWAAHDLDLRRQLKLFPSERHEVDACAERDRDRAALLQALRRQGLWPASEGDLPQFDQALVEAAYVFLARTPCMILMVQFEDILGQLEQPNLPGTVAEHPNWRRKLPAQLDDVMRDPRVIALARRLSSIRRIPSGETETES